MSLQEKSNFFYKNERFSIRKFVFYSFLADFTCELSILSSKKLISHRNCILLHLLRQFFPFQHGFFLGSGQLVDLLLALHEFGGVISGLHSFL